MNQITFCEAEYQTKKRKTRRQIFPELLDKPISWKCVFWRFRSPVQPNAPGVILSLRVIGMPHFAHGFSHGFPFQIQLVTVVQKAVQNRACQSRVADSFVPLTDRQLAGDQGGTLAIAVIAIAGIGYFFGLKHEEHKTALFSSFLKTSQEDQGRLILQVDEDMKIHPLPNSKTWGKTSFTETELELNYRSEVKPDSLIVERDTPNGINFLLDFLMSM